jgi:hypothetical protein
MELFLGKFVLLYLLLPLMGVLLGVVMLLIAKKNNLLGNKKAVFYFLLSCIVLALPALLGFIDYWFMPGAYIGLLVLYFILGYLNRAVLKSVIDNLEERPYHVEFLCVFFVMLTGATLFSLVFNLCNELQYGLWACTCLLSFILPSLFMKAYESYLNIPLEVYRTWSYAGEGRGLDSEYMTSNKIIVVELELFKQLSDKDTLNIKVKASEDMPFGVWFKVLIEDYNRKSPLNPIAYRDDELGSHEWIFYVNLFFFGWKKYIDPDLSFARNKIREKNCIIAKRVQQEQQE